MDIKDCKFGTRVVCINDEGGNIPSGTLGTIIEDNQTCPFVTWDEYFNDIQFDRDGYKNVCGMYLREIEVLKENSSEETNIGKLTVSLATEDTNEIAKDILKIVLQDLNVIISDAIDSLSNDNEEVKQPLDVPTVGSNVDFSDDKLQSMFEEVMKDVMKEYLRDSINTLNKTAFNI